MSSLFLQWVQSSGIAELEDWPPIWKAIDEGWQDDHGVALWPSWAAYDGPGLGALLDSKGASHETHFLHAQPIEVADLSRFSTLWLVAPFGEEPSLPNAAPQLVATSRPIRLWRAERPHAATTFDALEALPRAQVEREIDAVRTLPCSWVQSQHRCDSRPWTAVREVVAEVGNTRRRVIFAHAFPDGGVLRIRWPETNLGAQLTGGIGFTLASVRNKAGSPTRVTITIAGERVWEKTLDIGDFDWHTVQVDTSRWLGQTPSLVVEVSAEDSGWRQMTFDLVATSNSAAAR